MERYKDWLKQSKQKLKSAKWAMKGEFWEDAAFFAQQSAELAAKSLLIARKMDHRGHAISRMLSRFDTPKEILNMAMDLDHHYTNARYPDAYDTGAPMEFYNETSAKRAIEYAEKIIVYIESELEKL